MRPVAVVLAALLLAVSAGPSPARAAPPAPVITRAEPLPGGARLAWTSQAGGPFQLRYRALQPAGDWLYRTLGTATSYDLTGLTEGTRYELRVRVKGRTSAATSSYSGAAFVTAGTTTVTTGPARQPVRCGDPIVDTTFIALTGDRPEGLDRKTRANGCTGYVLGAGADGLTWNDVTVDDVGGAVWQVTAPVANLTIDGLTMNDTGFGIEVAAGGGIAGVTVRNVTSTGFSRSLAYLHDGRDGLFERVTLDGNQYNDAGYVQGLRVETWTALTVRDLTATDLLDDVPARSFPQGEALDLARSVTGVRVERIRCERVADTCIDSKSRDLVVAGAVTTATRHGLRLWDDATIDGHVSRDVARTHVWATGPDTVVVHTNVDWSDPDASTAVTWSVDGAQHVVRSGTICRHPSAPLTRFERESFQGPDRPTIFEPAVTIVTSTTCPRT